MLTTGVLLLHNQIEKMKVMVASNLSVEQGVGGGAAVGGDKALCD